jgi:molybdopterin biosynthesis enzyme
MAGFSHVSRVTVRAEWTGTWPSTPGQEEAVPVMLDLDDHGVVTATPLGDGRGGVSLATLVESDAIAWIDADVVTLANGDTVRCTVWER